MGRAARRNARERVGAGGETGARGAQGRPDDRGLAGPPGIVRPAEVLAVVDDQLDAIRKALEIQVHRMAQLQQQLDQIQGLVKQVLATIANRAT
jgi:hypothetical protein